MAEDRYWLVHGWLDHQECQGGVFNGPEEVRSAFARLLRAVPFDRMHPRFVSDVVGHATDVRGQGDGGWEICLSAMRHASLAALSRPSRHASLAGPTSLFGHEIETHIRFPAAACRGLPKGASCHAAILLGFPLVLQLTKSYYDTPPTVDFAWTVALPDRQVARPSSLQRDSEALMLDLEVTLAEARATRTLVKAVKNLRVIPGDYLRTGKNVMGQRWDDVFEERSRFTNDKGELVMRVRVTMRGHGPLNDDDGEEWGPYGLDDEV
jgi:hypothetical protein